MRECGCGDSPGLGATRQTQPHLADPLSDSMVIEGGPWGPGWGQGGGGAGRKCVWGDPGGPGGPGRWLCCPRRVTPLRLRAARAGGLLGCCGTSITRQLQVEAPPFKIGRVIRGPKPGICRDSRREAPPPRPHQPLRVLFRKSLNSLFVRVVFI